MRKMILLAVAVALLVAPQASVLARVRANAPSAAGAQADSLVRALFVKHQAGGPEMIAALDDLLNAHEICSAEGLALIGDVVAEARRANLDQKIAAGQALSKMQERAAAGNEACGQKISQALRGADELTLAAYQAAQGDVVARDGGQGAGASIGVGSGYGGGGGGGGNTGGGGQASPN